MIQLNLTVSTNSFMSTRLKVEQLKMLVTVVTQKDVMTDEPIPQILEELGLKE